MTPRTEARKASSRAYYERNKELVKARSRLRYADNEDEVRASQKRYREGHKEKLAEKAKEYLDANRDRVREYQKSYRASKRSELTAKQKEWVLANPEKRKAAKRRHYQKHSSDWAGYASARRAAKLKATPPWADLNAIREVYVACAKISEETGIPHNVDHEVPLQGELVCGLHVEANLQILPATVNKSKHNRFSVQ